MYQPPMVPMAPQPPARRSRRGLIIGLVIGAVLLIIALVAALLALLALRDGADDKPKFAVGDCVSGLPDAPQQNNCDRPAATYRVVRVNDGSVTCESQQGHFSSSKKWSYCVTVNLLVGSCYDDAGKFVQPAPDCAGYAFRVLKVLDGDRTAECATVAGANNWIRTRDLPTVTYCGWRKPHD